MLYYLTPHSYQYFFLAQLGRYICLIRKVMDLLARHRVSPSIPVGFRETFKKFWPQKKRKKKYRRKNVNIFAFMLWKFYTLGQLRNLIVFNCFDFVIIFLNVYITCSLHNDFSCNVVIQYAFLIRHAVLTSFVTVKDSVRWKSQFLVNRNFLNFV